MFETDNEKGKAPDEYETDQIPPSNETRGSVKRKSEESATTEPSPFEQLPNELKLIVFSHLNFLELNKVSQVNRRINTLLKGHTFWRNAIDRYFPYLKEEKNTEYQQNPQKLFTTQYTSFSEEFPKNLFSHEAILFALSGSLERIASLPLSLDDRDQLYIIAAANGHLNALDRLNNLDKGRVFALGATCGSFSVVQHILAQTDVVISQWNKRCAFEGAARNNRFSIINSLLPLEVDGDSDKGLMLITAAEYGHLQIVDLLLEKVGATISPDNKGAALIRASLNNHLQIVDLLLEKAGAAISAKDKRDALSYTAPKQIFTPAFSAPTTSDSKTENQKSARTPYKKKK